MEFPTNQITSFASCNQSIIRLILVINFNIIIALFSDWEHYLVDSKLSYKIGWRISVIVLLKVDPQCLSISHKYYFFYTFCCVLQKSLNHLNYYWSFLILFYQCSLSHQSLWFDTRTQSTLERDCGFCYIDYARRLF